jgi:hypothetical protein
MYKGYLERVIQIKVLFRKVDAANWFSNAIVTK